MKWRVTIDVQTIIIRCQNRIFLSVIHDKEEQMQVIMELRKKRLETKNLHQKFDSKHPQALKFSRTFGDFREVYGGFISFIGAGFAAGASALLLDRLKNKGSVLDLGH